MKHNYLRQRAAAGGGVGEEEEGGERGATFIVMVAQEMEQRYKQFWLILYRYTIFRTVSLLSIVNVRIVSRVQFIISIAVS